jgi:hypothetical protein
LAQSLLAGEPSDVVLPHMQRTVAAYTSALERILGAPDGSLTLLDHDTLRQWIAPSPGGTPEAGFTALQ